MPKLNKVLTWTVWVTAWPLLGLMILYLLTGYVLCGQISRWISVETALKIHRFFDVPLVTLLAAHVLPAVYLAFARWGWIRKTDKT